jgi:L-ascorbate metabolism protein UlaG (beta-lactamase superfamily)
VSFAHMQPASEVPADLTPEQAAEAAAILRSNAVLPMHFGVHSPPYYVEEDDPLTRLGIAATRKSLRVLSAAPGEAIDAVAA